MWDGLVALRRVAGEAAGLGWRRLRPPGADAPPADAAALTPAWLSGVLGEGWPGARVERARVVGGDAGTTARVRLALHHGAGSPAGLPEHLFVKFMPPGFAQQLFVRVMQLGSREVRFYAELAGEAPLRVPRCYGARMDPRSGRFVLLLEDLQSAGCGFRTVRDPCREDELCELAVNLARLHAHFWESPRFERELSWVAPQWNARDRPLQRLVVRAALKRLLARHREELPGSLPEDVAWLRDHLDEAYAAWARPPLTLLHGDTHLGNLFFPSEGARVGLLDWQVAHRGEGIRDLSYFLVNSLPAELRERHERELLSLYRETLAENGVGPPSPEALWERHRLHAIYTWIASAVTRAVGGMQREDVARAALARSNRAVLEFESFALLRAQAR